MPPFPKAKHILQIKSTDKIIIIIERIETKNESRIVELKHHTTIKIHQIQLNVYLFIVFFFLPLFSCFLLFSFY